MPQWLLVASLMMSPGQPGVQPDEPDPDIVALEQRLFRAIEEKNRPVLESLVAAQFVLRGEPDTDREGWLKNAVSLCWGPSWDIQRVAVREQDGTQIATFILNFYRDPITCRAAPMRSLITDIWVREEGQWKLAMRHSGPVGEALRTQFAPVPVQPPPFEARAELSFVATGGNASAQTVGSSGDLIRRHARSTTTGRASFIRSATDGVESARMLTGQVRHGVRISDRVEAFGRGGYLRDLFAGLVHRVNADAGFSYVVPQPPQRALKFDFGLGATHEDRLADANLTVLNATLGLSLRARLAPAIEVSAESQVVADLGTLKNWRLSNDLSLNSSLNAHLSARMSYTTRIVNQPVPGFQRADHVLSASLVLRYVRPAPAVVR